VAEHFAVTGGARLQGSVDVVGAKNSVLKLMAAALLAEGTTTLTNCPEILDVPLMADVLRSLGCGVTVERDVVAIDVPAQLGAEADYRSVSKLRASVCVLGPLIARCRRAVVPLPGGDAIGSRPLDMHQAGLQRLGATMEIEHGRVVARGDLLRGAQIWLDFPSVGATENILMAAVLADGTTVIDNAAREPEIVDLAAMLTQMGAKIEGIGSSTLTVHGVTALQPTEHRVIGDRIVGATWAFAAAMTGARSPCAASTRTTSTSCWTSCAAPGRRPRRARRSSPCGWTAVRARSTSSRCPTRASPPTCSRWRSRCPPWPTALR
jgi:UDP-N-acetylglucosamine 1-carboxyvinyltransferase